MSNTKFINVAVSDEELSEKFKSLLYNFGEINWNILTSDAWNEFINNNRPFSEVQMQDLRDFVDEFEVPDRESELIEMLEKVIHNSDVPHYLLDEAKELIKSVKQSK